MRKLSKQTFLQGAIVIMTANLIVKFIGMAFKIPLAWLIEEPGMAIFNTAYQTYILFFIIATTGLPIAASKMVSEQLAVNNFYETKRIFKAEMILIISLGMLGAAVMFFFSDLIAVVVRDESTAESIRTIAPALIFVAVMAGYRGFFQGTQNMFPTAISEVVEALGKPAVGYPVALLLISQGIASAASGAIFGVTVGAFAGALVIMFMYLSSRKNILGHNAVIPRKTMSTAEIYKKLMVIAFPITLGACVQSLTNFIDTIMVRSRLQDIVFSPELARRIYDFYNNPALASVLTGKFDSEAARWLFGAYTGYAATIFGVPLTLIIGVSISVVPALASAMAERNDNAVKRITASAIRITVLLATPCAIGIMIMSKPILHLFFGNTASSQMLEILGGAIVWITLVSVTTGILQGCGRVYLPVINMAIGAVIKIAFNYYLIGIPNINALGAAIGTNVCYFIIAGLNIYWIMKIIRAKFSIMGFVVKPLFATAVMGAATLLCYNLTDGIIPMRIATILSMGLGAAVYAVVLIITGGISREDIEMLPKGQKLAGVMSKYKMLRD